MVKLADGVPQLFGWDGAGAQAAGEVVGPGHLVEVGPAGAYAPGLGICAALAGDGRYDYARGYGENVGPGEAVGAAEAGYGVLDAHDLCAVGQQSLADIEYTGKGLFVSDVPLARGEG